MALDDLPETDVQAISGILYSHHYSVLKQKNREAYLKLKAIKTDIIGRLARNLIIGQFHDVVAPLLLSRTIFTGKAEFNSNGEDNASNGNYSRYHWQHHWRMVLRLFTVSYNAISTT
jgi:site-specific DNA-adenine methylase